MKAQTVQSFLQLHKSQKSRAETIAVDLRKFDILPKGGRGPHAPEISLGQAIQFICAHAGAEVYRDVEKAAVEFPEFRNENEMTLFEYLTNILTDYDKLKHLDHIQFLGWKVVRVFWNDRSKKTTDYFLPSAWWEENSASSRPISPSAVGCSLAGRSGFIGGEVLLGIMGNWRDEPDGEIVTKLKNYPNMPKRSGWVGDD